MGYLANLVKVKAASAAGLGPFAIGATEVGFVGFGGIPNGSIVSYGIEDGSSREVGRGLYNSVAGTVTRNLAASSTGALLNLTENATMFITALAEDFDRGYAAIQGGIPSNTAGALTTSITLSSCACWDSTARFRMVLETPVSVPLNTNWVDTVEGGRDPAIALANDQTWHLHRFMNPLTGAITHFWSASAFNPPSPGAGYTVWRRLFSIRLEVGSTAIRQFEWSAGWVMLETRSTDAVALADNQSAGILRSISVPRGLLLNVLFWYTQTTSTTSTYPVYIGIFSPDRPVPAFGVSTQYGHARLDNAQQRYFSGQVWQFCDTNGQVYSASTDANGVIAFGVIGWEEPRDMWF